MKTITVFFLFFFAFLSQAHAQMGYCSKSGECSMSPDSIQVLPKEDPAKKEKISMYAAPATSSVNLNLKNDYKDMNVCVYNALGHCVIAHTASEVSPIDMSGQPRGIYLMSIEGKNHREVKKIIVE